MNLPTVRQLECLLAVAEHLNFRVAAESCFITQPALSAQIQQLELVLGLKLFERDRRRVLPTAVGVAMADKARRVLAELRDMAEAATTFSDPLSGTLKLGVIPTVAPYALPKGLKEVHQRYPRLRVLLTEGQTSRVLAMLADGSLDLVLLALEVDLGDAESRALFEDPFMFAVPESHRLAGRQRVSEKDLESEEILLLDDGHCLRDQALSFCNEVKATEFGDFRATSLSTLVQMVSGGLGVTLLPKLAMEVEAAADRRIKVIPFGANGPSRTIGIAWRSSSMRKPEFELFGEALLAGQSGLG